MGCSKSKGDYVTLPGLGQGVSCRHTNRVKVWTINLDGRINYISPLDQLMAEESPESSEAPTIEGYVGVFIILDRRMPSGTDSSLLDQHVRVDQLSRFKVLMRERRYVNTSMLTLKRFLK